MPILEISSLLVVATGSFLACLMLTPLVRNAFLRRGILDRPDGARKLHAHAVPRIGGIPILASYAAGLGAAAWGRDGFGDGRLELLFKLGVPAGIIFVTGLLDDLRGLRPWQKLAGQLAGAVWAVWAGVRIAAVAGHPLGPAAGAVLTMVWLVGCINAFNLIDGLDGLASGMGLFSALTIFVAALLYGDHALALSTLPLCGALAGFLRYNFNPASVFLGDCGSLTIGFLLGCYGVIWSQKSATLLGMTAPLIALAIPLLDVVLSVVRRWLRGQPIFGGDRNHIHHRLLGRGLTHRRVVLVLYLVCGIYAALSLLASLGENRFPGLILVLFCGVTWVGVQNLGYTEFGVAGRVLLGGSLRRVVHGQLVLKELEESIRKATGTTQCWDGVVDAARQFGFREVRARLHGQSWTMRGAEPSRPLWLLRVPLSGGDYVQFAHALDEPLPPVVVGPLVVVLHWTLRARLDALARPLEIESLLNLASSVDGSRPLKQETEAVSTSSR